MANFSAFSFQIFLVRYDGDRQATLAKHTDNGDLTFSALLSDGFEGGGTRYWNRNTSQPFKYLLPDIGQVTLFPGVISHEGVQVTKGRRYLLIGFLAVDKYDPFTQKPTGLSWFASWGSLNWATVKFRFGYDSAVSNLGHGIQKWTTHKVVRGLFVELATRLYDVGDIVMPHFFTPIIQPNSTNAFLEAMDDAYYQSRNAEEGNTQYRPNDEANWFQGQLTNVDIDGTISSFDKARREKANLFEGELS